ncbi:MAG: NAD-dependent epimerase/dehydratase family protein [Candidatus Cloacimonas sp.]
MKIAITGANGFVGSNLVKHFLSTGFEVKALIRASASSAFIPPQAQIERVDYNNPISLSTALRGIDIIIHNAGKTKALNSEQMFKANVGITEKIVSVMNNLPEQQQLIYLSSQAATLPCQNNVPLKEDEPCAPITCYGKSKLAAEQMIQKQCKKNYTIIRPCSIYGCGDKDFLQLFKMVSWGFGFKIGRKDKLLNMIYVSELAQFVELCVNNPAAYSQIFFATDGHIYRQSEIVKAIAKALNKNPVVITIPEFLALPVFYAGDLYGRIFHKEVVINREKMKEIMADAWLADIGKAREILHWNPIANLEEHLKETAKCYRALGWL